jgi:putative endonuclease
MQFLAPKPAVYVLASRRSGTLYVGATTELRERVRNHRSGHGGGFTTKHSVRMLVYYEFSTPAKAGVHLDIQTAMTRERQIKKWKRAWKLALIEQHNPNWRDLYEDNG